MKLPLSFCLFATAASLALAEPQKVDADKVPVAVLKALQAQSGGKQPSSIERDDADGVVVYEGIFSAGTPEERSVTVTEDGTLVGADLTLADLPAPVQKTITAQIADGKLDGIEKNSEDSAQVTYDVDFITKSGQDRTMSIAEDGTLISLELGLEDTPEAVQNAIKSQVAEGKLGEIDKIVDGDVVTYDVESMTKDGKPRNFTLNADGTIESLEIALAEATEPAQKTIRNRIGEGKLLRVAETFKNQKLTGYDVDGAAAGKSISFHVGLKGKFLGTLE